MAKAKRKGPPPRGNRPPVELSEERARRAWVMRQQNYTMEEIASELGIAAGNVSRALAKIRAAEYLEFAKTREQHKIDQTRQIEHIASQAMRAWEKSKTPLQKGRSTTNKDTDAEVIVTEAIEREGNPTYLYLVLKCMDDIRKIWGFDVLPAEQDVGATMASVIRDLNDRAERYKAEIEGSV